MVSRHKTSVSVVVPAFNEQENIPVVYQAIKDALDPLELAYEVIFIDDGSTDSTFEKMQQLNATGHTLKCIQLRRNFGKSVALGAGFKQATGAAVVTMDADLQDDPKEIPRLLDKLHDGWDVVSGWKAKRRDPLEKRFASRVFNWVVSSISGLKLHDFNCGLKAYAHEVVHKLHIYGGQHRFIPVIASSYGFKVTEITVNHRQREFGKSKYGFGRYFAGLFDLFTIMFLMLYERRPLHFLARIATIPFLLGSSFIVYVIVMKFGYGETGNRPTLTAGVFLVGLAFQIFFFGLIAELVTHLKFSSSYNPSDYTRQTIIRDDLANKDNLMDEGD